MTATRRDSGLKIRPVVFDSWAWWEVLDGGPHGAALSRKYVEAPEVRVLTVDLARAELSARLARAGRERDTASVLAAVDAASEVVPITAEAAETAGSLWLELRRVDPSASLDDAVMLAVARTHRATLVSGDGCFRGQPDVSAR